MQIDPRNLRRLVARAEALLDGRYEVLEARRSKGARDPHRLVVLIARANEMIDQLEREGRFELTGEYAVTLSELEAVVPLVEEAATIPGFEDAHLAQTKDYAHTAVMLSARARGRRTRRGRRRCRDWTGTFRRRTAASAGCTR